MSPSDTSVRRQPVDPEDRRTARPAVRLAPARAPWSIAALALIAAILGIVWQRAEPERIASTRADRFLDVYVTDHGRVVRLDQGGDTVSEGQAYAMLLAVALDDRERFDRIWTWADAHLRRDDGLFSWHWRDGAVVDAQPAADADLDIAHALLLAARQFNDRRYRDQAIAIGDAILAHETIQWRGQPLLAAGRWATTKPSIVNPSYFSPCAMKMLGRASGDAAWTRMARASRAAFGQLVHRETGLVPDWAQVDGDAIRAIGGPDDVDAAPVYGFDALRAPIRMAQDPGAGFVGLAADMWPTLAMSGPAALPAQQYLDGRPVSPLRHASAMAGAAAAADAAGDTEGRDRMLVEAWRLDERSPTYYGAVISALAQIILTTDLLGACGE